MFSFIWILEKLFSGFAVDADTKLVQALAEQGDESVFVVKKSTYYVTLFSWFRWLLIFLVAGVNILLLLTTHYLPNKIIWSLSGFLLLHLFLRLVTIVRYLYKYNRTYNTIKIMPSSEWVPILQQGDTLFRNFFNQTIWLLGAYIAVIVIFVRSTVKFLLPEKNLSFFVVFMLVANILLFIWQGIQIIALLGRFIDLEMDFVLVTSRTIKFYNQCVWGVETKTLDIDKIKTIESIKTDFLSSVLNYGNVYIYAEGDSTKEPDLILEHIFKPETVERLLDDIKRL